MAELLKIIKGVVSDFGKHLTGSKIKEFQSVDPLSKKLLDQNLYAVNSRRAVFVYLFSAVICAVCAVITLINISTSDFRSSFFSLLGFLIIIFGCGISSVLIYREYKRRRTDEAKLQRLIMIFWIIFSAGLLLLTAADFSCNVFSYRFCMYLIVMSFFPLLNLKRSLLIICPFLALILILGFIFSADALTMFLSVVFSLAYVMISSLVYSSYCCLWISDRQLNTANERCRQINEKDALTGLLNKKGLIRRLMDIMDRGADKNIAAIFFGIDNFKRYNQIYTDTESDECLYNICNCVRIIAKSQTDIISRFGGDEFVIIVQNTTEYDLVYFAEQIRKSVETMALPFENNKVVTITVGVSSIIEDEFTDYSRLLKEAEDSLALAKNGGKNCVGYMGNVFKAT